ncbi:cytidine deaminase-like protein [Pyronema omphalodes]|nr:cytidine deaminase-like protein [Pyronema omphalodes]
MEISRDVREHFMRETFTALRSPCPRYPFGAVIVNHTATVPKIICKGRNMNNIHNAYPHLHGEMAAIAECTKVLGESGGWKDLSLYTNAEACPMCASAIRWAGFKEYIYGTSIEKLMSQGWGQIEISSHEVFQKSSTFKSETAIIGNILTNETDALFAWQFSPRGSCPDGCMEVPRPGRGRCIPEDIGLEL